MFLNSSRRLILPIGSATVLLFSYWALDATKKIQGRLASWQAGSPASCTYSLTPQYSSHKLIVLRLQVYLTCMHPPKQFLACLRFMTYPVFYYKESRVAADTYTVINVSCSALTLQLKCVHNDSRMHASSRPKELYRIDETADRPKPRPGQRAAIGQTTAWAKNNHTKTIPFFR